MTWSDQARGWLAEPDEVVNALSDQGFQECKREIARNRRDHRPAGGVWQGINPRTGSVASAIWVGRTEPFLAMVFIDIGSTLSLIGVSRARRDVHRPVNPLSAQTRLRSDVRGLAGR